MSKMAQIPTSAPVALFFGARIATPNRRRRGVRFQFLWRFACEKGEEAGSAASFEKFAIKDKIGRPDVIRPLDASAFRKRRRRWRTSHGRPGRCDPHPGRERGMEKRPCCDFLILTSYFIWSPITGEKPPDTVNDGKGPDNMKAKAEIIKYLKDSFAFGHKSVATLNSSKPRRTDYFG
jgi:hypothetical protein